jgi:hypothetical protein
MVDAHRLRRWWWHLQGLDGALAGRPAAEVLQQSGWARSVGGAGPLDRGRITGLWEYDPERESIAWWSFVGKDQALREGVARTEAFIRADLGDVRAFSLDSPKSRIPRIEALRNARSGSA